MLSSLEQVEEEEEHMLKAAVVVVDNEKVELELELVGGKEMF